MTFTGAQINKLEGGLAGGETSGRVAVVVAGAGAVSGTLEHHRKYELLQIEDAERLGFTEENDAENSELTYHHLSEIFRLSPETRIFLIAVPKATKASELKNLNDFVAALRTVQGVNTIGITGLADDSSLEIAVKGSQILVDNLAKDYIYIDVVLIEGKGDYLGKDIVDFPDLRAFDCENISVVIGQDPAVASLDPLYAGYAAVGSALGMLAVRAIHENLGSVDIEVKPGRRKAENDYTLTDAKTGKWLDASLSNGTKFETVPVPSQGKLDESGYIYAGNFSGYGGYFFSNSHTCTESGSDYCFIERNAIWNKAARIIRETLIPRIRSKVQSDPSTGYIKNTTVTDWDGRVRKALEPMKNVGNIADFDIYINPKQAAVSTKPFNIKVQLVADGIVHEFEIDLGFTKSI
jgi:hypothetical protein